MSKKFKWIIEFEVDEIWVADGFNLTASRAIEMVKNVLPYAHDDELSTRTIKSPDPQEIKHAQGFYGGE